MTEANDYCEQKSRKLYPLSMNQTQLRDRSSKLGNTDLTFRCQTSLIHLKNCAFKYFFPHQSAFSANQGVDEAHPITPLVNITKNFKHVITLLPAYS